jgi:hypothetical protein
MDFLENYEEANVYFCYNNYPRDTLSCLYCNANYMSNISPCILGYTSEKNIEQTCNSYIGDDKIACINGFNEGQKLKL